MTHEPTEKFNKDFTAYYATDPKISWVEGVAILVAVIIVVLVGSVNDYQKEAQFRKLNAKKEDREVKVHRNYGYFYFYLVPFLTLSLEHQNILESVP